MEIQILTSSTFSSDTIYAVSCPAAPDHHVQVSRMGADSQVSYVSCFVILLLLVCSRHNNLISSNNDAHLIYGSVIGDRIRSSSQANQNQSKTPEWKSQGRCRLKTLAINSDLLIVPRETGGLHCFFLGSLERSLQNNFFYYVKKFSP